MTLLAPEKGERTIGADFDCAWIPNTKLDEGRIKKLLEIATSEKPDDWDGRCDSVEECRGWIVEAVEYLANVPNMGTSFVKVSGEDYPIILSGGESGGGWDLPDINREMFEILNRHAPAVMEQTGTMGKGGAASDTCRLEGRRYGRVTKSGSAIGPPSLAVSRPTTVRFVKRRQTCFSQNTPHSKELSENSTIATTTIRRLSDGLPSSSANGKKTLETLVANLIWWW